MRIPGNSLVNVIYNVRQETLVDEENRKHINKDKTWKKNSIRQLKN